jgi:hypothetical protein
MSKNEETEEESLLANVFLPQNKPKKIQGLSGKNSIIATTQYQTGFYGHRATHLYY